MRDHEFSIWLQPKVDAVTLVPAGVEGTQGLVQEEEAGRRAPFLRQGGHGEGQAQGQAELVLGPAGEDVLLAPVARPLVVDLDLQVFGQAGFQVALVRERR